MSCASILTNVCIDFRCLPILPSIAEASLTRVKQEHRSPTQTIWIYYLLVRCTNDWTRAYKVQPLSILPNKRNTWIQLSLQYWFLYTVQHKNGVNFPKNKLKSLFQTRRGTNLVYISSDWVKYSMHGKVASVVFCWLVDSFQIDEDDTK